MCLLTPSAKRPLEDKTVEVSTKQWKMAPQLSKILELSVALLTKMRQAGVWVEANVEELWFSHTHFHVCPTMCSNFDLCVVELNSCFSLNFGL